ncbi:MAG: hypothetical protein QOH93_3286 [Chloroflexia bacterium]|nr:hypothetical protein [Chloroflexia bacterium]
MQALNRNSRRSRLPASHHKGLFDKGLYSLRSRQAQPHWAFLGLKYKLEREERATFPLEPDELYELCGPISIAWEPECVTLGQFSYFPAVAEYVFRQLLFSGSLFRLR